MAHFKINNLFSKQEFGFIKGRSTTLQLLFIFIHYIVVAANKYNKQT